MAPAVLAQPGRDRSRRVSFSEEQIKRYRNLAKELEYQFMNPEEKKAYKRARRAAAGEVVTGGGRTSVEMYKEKK